DRSVVLNGSYHQKTGIVGLVAHSSRQTPVIDVTVELRDTFGRLVSTTQTNESGIYHFADPEYGSQYIVVFPDNPELTFISPQTIGPLQITTERPRVNIDNILVAPVRGTADVVGNVWEDLNIDGIRTANERGVDHALVQLLNSGFVVVAETSTDEAGNYRFPGANTIPGDHIVRFVNLGQGQSANYFSPRVTGQPIDVIANDALPNRGDTALFVLPAHSAQGERSSVQRNAAIYYDATVVGRLWDDVNRNGQWSTIEATVDGVTVRIVNTNGDEIANVVTRRDGNFNIALTPGEYRIYVPNISNVTLPEQFVAAGSEWYTTFTATSGQRSQIDVTYLGNGEQTEVSGQVWSDTNGDGIRQSEEPFYAGVPVALLGSQGEQQHLVSDEQGRYRFTGLPSGNYHVTATLPSNQFFSPYQVGDDSNRDSDINRWIGQSPEFALLSGEQRTTFDIGVYVGDVSSNVVDALRVTEVGFIGHGNAEFTEVKNVSSAPISLKGVRFTKGIRYDFDKSLGRVLFPGEHAIVIGQRNSLAQRFNIDTLNVAGKYDGDLNREERLTILDDKDQIVTSFRYDDDWFIIMDNEYLPWTLTIRDEHAAESTWDTPVNWRPSSILAGTPGAEDPRVLPDPGAVVINEVLPKAVDGNNDLIELHNTTDTDIDISYWFLGDSESVVDRLYYLTRYQIAAGTILPAHGYLVFSRTQNFGNLDDPGTSLPFGLSSQGEAVHLIAADRFGRMQGYSDSVFFDATRKGVTMGRLNTYDGGNQFVALASSSLGAENTSTPLIGPIVIDQIMYHAELDSDDYIRLVNVSDETVKLADGDSRWKLSEGISFTFESNDRLLPGQHAFVSASDPATFRERFSIPADIPVFGPFAGKLSDTDDEIRIYDTRDDGRQILADQVAYRDVAPWPVSSLQTNVPLTRRDTAWLGNDSSNWSGASMADGAHVGNGAFAKLFANIPDDSILPGNYLGFVLDIATAGDANGDGRFDSRDLVQVFQAGLYETNETATWLTGDWNRDGMFNTRDLVSAFTVGQYSAGA
ncbi:MAG: lamin tail domain-containing protein, partial [Planctomycetales bacterium]|nr:lamin tail domain-containing protein [Planctomycetales bacterium]